MQEILQSLETEGRDSPYFKEVQTYFRNMRHEKLTEAQLRRDWQGRGSQGHKKSCSLSPEKRGFPFRLLGSSFFA